MISIDELNKKYQEIKNNNYHSISKLLMHNILKIEKCDLPIYEDMGGVCFIYNDNIYGYRYLIDNDGYELSIMFDKKAVFKGLKEIYDELNGKDIEDVIWVRNVYSRINKRFEIKSNHKLEEYKKNIIKYFNIKNKEYLFLE